MQGLGIGAISLDWSTIAAYNGNPLVSPFFAIVNIAVGYFAVMYVIMPLSYWGMNLYNAKTFPFFSSHLFNGRGEGYNVSGIVNDKFELDIPAYAKEGHIYLSTFFAVTYGLGFAAVVATLSHVILFNGR